MASKTSTEQCGATARRLIEWYWTTGAKRRARYALDATWIADVHEQAAIVDALAHSGHATRRTLAVWGPSQSGKSTLLSYFLDSRDPAHPASAIDWGSAGWRFSASKDFPGAPHFNPENSGNDASSCVTRFTLAETVSYPDYPIEIARASRRQILQALAAGYLSECKLRPEQKPQRFWDATSLREELRVGDGVPDRRAYELILDAAVVVDRLLDDASNRYVNLSADNAWKKELRRAVLGARGLAASTEAAERFVFGLLWDGHDSLNRLASEIESFRLRLDSLFGGRRVYASLDFASMILDMSAYQTLTRKGEFSPEKSDTLNRLMTSCRYAIQGDAVFIGTGASGGRPLFDGSRTFGLLQALVWELRAPLSAPTLRALGGREALQLLETFDLLDIPGVARPEIGAVDTLLDLENPDIDPEILFTRVIKRGKTATIINHYAEEMRIDAVLLLNKAVNPWSKPRQLTEGVKAIWRYADPAYHAGRRAQSPVPLVLCLTFLSQVADPAANNTRPDLSALFDRLSQLGPLTKLALVLASNHSHLEDYRSSAETRRDVLLPAIVNLPFFTGRTNAALEQDSFAAALTEPDGGLGRLLETLAALPPVERAAMSRTWLNCVEECLSARIRDALPQRGGGRRRQEVIAGLTETIEARLDNGKGGEDTAEPMSSDMREALVFKAQDFKPFPKNNGANVDGVEEYLRGELAAWESRDKARDALARLGVSGQDWTIILSAITEAVDVPAVARWCVGAFGDVTGDDRAKHMRRYVAAKCAATIANATEFHDATPADPNAVIQKRFEAWDSTGVKSRHSPHYEMVIVPALRQLRGLARSGADAWEEQPGDDEIVAIHESWSIFGAST